VDPRIRSSSAVNAHWLAKDTLKRAFHIVLDGIVMRLALPAGDRCAVVRYDEF
jgi:hypothetical protein